MAGQTESGTQLNSGQGGDIVRDVSLTITPPGGTPQTQKQQITSIADPIDPNRLIYLDSEGVAEVYPRSLTDLLWLTYLEMRHIRLILQDQTANDSDTAGTDRTDEEDSELREA